MFRNDQTKIPGSEPAIDKMFLLVTKLQMLALMKKPVHCKNVQKYLKYMLVFFPSEKEKYEF
jgi:hypothetical protein